MSAAQTLLQPGSAALSVTSSFALQSSLTAQATAAFTASSSAAVAGRLQWEPEAETAETWTDPLLSAKTWTEQLSGSETWSDAA